MSNHSLVVSYDAEVPKDFFITPRIIATGGLATLMAGVCDTIEEVDPTLTLEGLRIIYELLENGAEAVRM